MRTYIGFSSVGNDALDTRLADAKLVNADLLNAFLIAPGEVPGRSGFGSIIRQAIGEPLDDGTRNALVAEVARVVGNDPRVELSGLEIVPDEHGISIYALLRYVELGIQDFLAIAVI